MGTTGAVIKLLLVLFWFCQFGIGGSEDQNDRLQLLTAAQVTKIVDNACVITVDRTQQVHLGDTLLKVSDIFREDANVVIGTIDLEDLQWPSGHALRWIDPFGKTRFKDGMTKRKVSERKVIVLFKRRVVDRTCLLQPVGVNNDPVAELLSPDNSLNELVAIINQGCGTFRTTEGLLSPVGLHRMEIIQGLFRVRSISNVTMEAIYSRLGNPLNGSHVWQQQEASNYCQRNKVSSPVTVRSTSASAGPGSLYSKPEEVMKMGFQSKGGRDGKNNDSSKSCLYRASEEIQPSRIPVCDVLTAPPTRDDFFHKYLKKSRPFIIRNVTSSWRATSRWSNNFLRQNYGQRDVHVKLTPAGDFEGVEPVTLWEDHETFHIPEAVRRQLQYPDLVMVRPAGVNMNLSRFLDIIEITGRQTFSRRLSAYLEYSSIRDYLPDLENDLEELEFASSILTRRHLNMWLSDGHTLGRLHFDQFDNLLCQLSGTKQVILFEPHDNRALYEGHIQQATLFYDEKTQRFSRSGLEDSTSMVMSPVDLLQPDFKRFPRFLHANPLNCTLTAGDILYMPAFWWHEVQSKPDTASHRNLAVNFWYEPFLTREFPCPDCALDVNPIYHNLL